LNNFSNFHVVHWDESSGILIQRDLLAEEPLSIRVQGNPYSVVMRTPGDEIAHVAGFCLGEGIIDTPDDTISIAYCDGDDTNVVAVTLIPARREKVTDLLDRRNYISQTSCGLCGKELVKDLYQLIQPVEKKIKIDRKKALTCLEALYQHQPLRTRTRASHAAALYDVDYKVMVSAEDVGRHNALDKAIGGVFLKGELEKVAFLVLSSRISYELVQKAARARIPIILAASQPTALAVELASQLNITLASLADQDQSGLYIFCRKERLVS
jgi:FdhD protein